jgi:hypothetical protein
VAIIAALAYAVPGPGEELSPRYGTVLRYAILATGCLTFVLNAYALAAIAYRTHQGGLTPNRHAVLGWNTVTLFMLGYVMTRLGLAKKGAWPDAFRASMALALLPAIAWGAWVVLGLPHF